MLVFPSGFQSAKLHKKKSQIRMENGSEEQQKPKSPVFSQLIILMWILNNLHVIKCIFSMTYFTAGQKTN